MTDHFSNAHQFVKQYYSRHTDYKSDVSTRYANICLALIINGLHSEFLELTLTDQDWFDGFREAFKEAHNLGHNVPEDVDAWYVQTLTAAIARPKTIEAKSQPDLFKHVLCSCLGIGLSLSFPRVRLVQAIAEETSLIEETVLRVWDERQYHFIPTEYL